MEWAKNQYNHQYDVWVPWLEDLYLRYFTRDNKASYTVRRESPSPIPHSLHLLSPPTPSSQITNTNPDLPAKENLDQAKNTNISQHNTLQDSGNDLVAGQLGQDGLGKPVGDMLSKEGMNRVERNGRDENGGYLPLQEEGGSTGAGAGAGLGGGVGDVGKGAVEGGRKAVGGLLGGLGGLG
jgi:hypothetical protein